MQEKTKMVSFRLTPREAELLKRTIQNEGRYKGISEFLRDKTMRKIRKATPNYKEQIEACRNYLKEINLFETSGSFFYEIETNFSPKLLEKKLLEAFGFTTKQEKGKQIIKIVRQFQNERAFLHEKHLKYHELSEHGILLFDIINEFLILGPIFE